MEKVVGGVKLFGFAGTTVKEESGGGEGFDPKLWRHGGMEKEDTNAVIECS